MQLRAAVGEVRIELQTRDTGLDGSISVALADAEDVIHIFQRETQRAFCGNDSTFNTGAGAVGDYRDAVLRADFDNVGDFGVTLWECNGCWLRAAVIGGIACVRVSDGIVSGKAVSEKGAE